MIFEKREINYKETTSFANTFSPQETPNWIHNPLKMLNSSLIGDVFEDHNSSDRPIGLPPPMASESVLAWRLPFWGIIGHTGTKRLCFLLEENGIEKQSVRNIRLIPFL